MLTDEGRPEWNYSHYENTDIYFLGVYEDNKVPFLIFWSENIDHNGMCLCVIKIGNDNVNSMKNTF